MRKPDQRSEKAKGYRRWYHRKEWFETAARVRRRQQHRCAMCGKFHQKLHVDHIKPHKGDEKLFFDEENLQGLCPDPCHNRWKQQQEHRGYHAGVDADGWPTDPSHPFNGS